MALPVFNSNGNQPIPLGTGNFCTITAPVPVLAAQSSGQNNSQVIDVASFAIKGGTATGTVTFQEVMPDKATWVNVSTSTPGTGLSVTLGASDMTGILNGPFLGLRMVFTSVAVATVPNAMLKGMIRSL